MKFIIFFFVAHFFIPSHLLAKDHNAFSCKISGSTAYGCTLNATSIVLPLDWNNDGKSDRSETQIDYQFLCSPGPEDWMNIQIIDRGTGDQRRLLFGKSNSINFSNFIGPLEMINYAPKRSLYGHYNKDCKLIIKTSRVKPSQSFLSELKEKIDNNNKFIRVLERNKQNLKRNIDNITIAEFFRNVKLNIDNDVSNNEKLKEIYQRLKNENALDALLLVDLPVNLAESIKEIRHLFDSILIPENSVIVPQAELSPEALALINNFNYVQSNDLLKKELSETEREILDYRNQISEMEKINSNTFVDL